MGDIIGPDIYSVVKLSTDGQPSGAIRGQKYIDRDTGDVYQWMGDECEQGGWYRTQNGGRQVAYVENPHEDIVNEHFHLHTAVSTTLAAAITVGDTSITVADPTGFIVGNEVQIENGTIEVTFPTITVIAGSVFTLDRPLDNAFSIGDTVGVVTTDLKTTAGTLAAPISYRVIPTAGEDWSISRILVYMAMSSSGDDSKFGDLTSLTNGLVIRKYVDGVYTTLTNWKNNGDIIHDGYDATYNQKSGGGNWGFVARWTFDRLNAEPRVDGDNGDYLEALVQDDITGLLNFQLKAQGYIDD